MSEEKKPETLPGTVMKNGGGAVAGAAVGWTIGGVLAAAAAPFTGGLSIVIPPLVAAATGVWAHKKSQELD